MEINYYLSISILILIVAFLFHRSKSIITHRRRPPSPPGSLPIIGHLHLLKQPLHRSLHFLSHKHGPIMWLNFGSHPVVVVSSSEADEECFTKNDVTLANRPNHMVGKHIGYNHTTMVQAPYGDHWRNLRRIGSLEIFSSARLNNFLAIRADEVKRLTLRLVSSSSSNNHNKVELRGVLQDLTLNNMMRMIAGKRYYGESDGDMEEADQFKEMMAEVMGIGSGNPANFIPLLKWVGFGGFERKLIRLSKKMDAFMQKLIDDRRCILEKDDHSKNTMIDHLLSLQQSQPEYYSDQIKGIIQIMLLAGTDTSAVTIEWAMSNLLNHPEKLKKARDEIDSQVGEERVVEESDLSKLKYIHNIISETLRLNPSAPLLVPHRSSKDFTLSGYHIPQNTMLLVNAWAIHRDPRVWEDATTFKPERFENDGDDGDNKYKLIPFGVGRRACPGTGLAHRMVGLTLATLIQCFDWDKLEEIDMDEGSGLTMPKLIPLQLNCKPRHPIFTAIFSSINSI